jgi:hypothetical protein
MSLTALTYTDDTPLSIFNNFQIKNKKAGHKKRPAPKHQQKQLTNSLVG